MHVPRYTAFDKLLKTYILASASPKGLPADRYQEVTSSVSQWQLLLYQLCLKPFFMFSKAKSMSSLSVPMLQLAGISFAVDDWKQLYGIQQHA